jgi:hypothetical protein
MPSYHAPGPDGFNGAFFFKKVLAYYQAVQWLCTGQSELGKYKWLSYHLYP